MRFLRFRSWLDHLLDGAKAIDLIHFEEVRRIEAWQHAVMVFQLCRAVWQRWMDTAVMAGALDIKGYEPNRTSLIACSWLPPKWDWVDPLKDARAEIE